MKTTIRTLWNSLLVVFLGTLLAGQAHGQIFVTNEGTGTIGEYDYNTAGRVNASLVSGLNYPSDVAVFGANLLVVDSQNFRIGEYNATTGATVNASLVSGLSNGLNGIAVSGNFLYITNYFSDTIGKYNATTGGTVNASLVSGLSGPISVAVSGANLFVVNNVSGTIGEYNANTGATVNASLVSGLSAPIGIVVSGTNLYVVNNGSGTIGEYTTSGVPVNPSLVSGLSSPYRIALAGGNLFVTSGGGTIGEYNATTGATVNASLVSGLSTPSGIAVVAQPAVFKYLTPVTLNANARGAVTVNEALNKIYVSGNPSDNNDIEVNVIDGNTFAVTDVGYGTQVSVDNKTNNYWAATIFGTSSSSFGCGSPPPYPAGVIVRDGKTDCVVATVNLGYCPIATAYDFFKDRMWVGAQCGALNDPVFAINANAPFNVIPGTPIGSNGVMGSVIVNGLNGRVYFYEPQTRTVSERIDPTTFQVTPNNFGEVRAINGVTNTLYAFDSVANNLQIVNGATEAVRSNIHLSYNPGSIGININSNYLYIANPAAQSIEVRNGTTGALVSTFYLSSHSVTPDGPMGVDSTRSRIYLISYTPSSQLLVIEDVINAATKPLCHKSN